MRSACRRSSWRLSLRRDDRRHPCRIMGRIELVTHIAAPPDRCFDLARSLELHMRSTAATGERAVGGTTTGLLGPGQHVTWRARHFLVWQELTSRITGYDRPRWFRDEQSRGIFQRLEHDHLFEAAPAGGTIMRDIFDYRVPLRCRGREYPLNHVDATAAKRVATRSVLRSEKIPRGALHAASRGERRPLFFGHRPKGGEDVPLRRRTDRAPDRRPLVEE